MTTFCRHCDADLDYNLKFCTECGNPLEVKDIFDDAFDEYNNKNYAEAVPVFKKLAEEGNAPAQFFLAMCYDEGTGVPQSAAKAFEWYLKNAQQGAAAGQRNVGAHYESGFGVTQNYSKAYEWYQKAALQDDDFACHRLGNCYFNGNGVTQNYAKAFEWFLKSANMGYEEAQYNLAVCYQDGKGTAQSYAEALKWYHKAADQGYANAMNNIGVFYEKGYGVKKDLSKAAEWYRKAVDNGDDENAENNLRALTANRQKKSGSSGSGAFNRVMAIVPGIFCGFYFGNLAQWIFEGLFPAYFGGLTGAVSFAGPQSIVFLIIWLVFVILGFIFWYRAIRNKRIIFIIVLVAVCIGGFYVGRADPAFPFPPIISGEVTSEFVE